jgi:hypothetical protein
MEGVRVCSPPPHNGGGFGGGRRSGSEEKKSLFSDPIILFLQGHGCFFVMMINWGDGLDWTGMEWNEVGRKGRKWTKKEVVDKRVVKGMQRNERDHRGGTSNPNPIPGAFSLQ